MKISRLLLLFVVLSAALMLLCSCSDRKAAELFDTAKFEELQNNQEHATKLYERIMTAYPNSEYAPKAKERLEAIRSGRGRAR